MSQSNLSTISRLESLYQDIAKQFQFPSNYKLLGKLGEGGFGLVLKCFNVDTHQALAMKIQDNAITCRNELTMMKLLMKNKLHESNIIRFIEVVPLKDNYQGLVYERLDVTLQQHLVSNNRIVPMEVQNIRSVIQQLATALDALKSLKVIHSDIKLDNIMLVDAAHQPLQVRLIDFGLAFPTWRAWQGANHQPLTYKAPEIILGVPFSEAIDMWSLGIVMMEILTGDGLFAADHKYGTVRNMVEILGFPPDHLLEAGLYSTLYFHRRDTGQWELKAPKEYWSNGAPPEDDGAVSVKHLDQVGQLPLPNLDGVDPVEMKECIDLLKAMLRFDARRRIIPSQVLSQPFIRRGSLQRSSVSHSNEFYEPPQRCVQTILVKPAAPESSLELDEDTKETEDTEDNHHLTRQFSPPLYLKESSVSDDTDLKDVKLSKTKKRKNVFTRFCRWVRKKVFCCNNVVDILD